MFGNYPYQPTLQSQFANQFESPYRQQSKMDIQMVNGPESASAYQMPPNSRQILMDKNIARFYLVETDATGMKSMKAYDFMEAKEESQPEYLTKREFEKWRESYESAIQGANQQADAEGVYGKHDPRRSQE